MNGEASTQSSSKFGRTDEVTHFTHVKPVKAHASYDQLDLQSHIAGQGLGQLPIVQKTSNLNLVGKDQQPYSNPRP